MSFKKFSVLSLILFSSFAWADPTASIDRSQMTLNDSLTFQIVDDNADADNPNFSALNQDFNILSTSTNAEIQVNNGKTTQRKVWTLILSPKHSGSLILPALKLGASSTEPLTLLVSDAASQNPSTAAPSAESIFMQTSFTPSSIYEGQAGLYTVKIFYKTAVREPTLSLPEMNDVKLIHVGKDVNHDERFQDQAYQVLEQHYAFIAQKDGVFDLKSPVLQGFKLNLNASEQASNPWQAFQISAPSLSVKVNTIPGMAKSSWWLPSTQISLNDSWSEHPPQFKAGVPITRTLTLKAQNLTAEQLPAIGPTQNSGFQLYPDKPILETNSNGFQLEASRVEKIAYLPNAQGQVTIPGIQIDWWNTDSNSPEQISLPEYSFTVAKGNGSTMIEAPTHLQPLALQNNQSDLINQEPISWRQNPFFILSIILAATWIGTLYLWLRKKPVYKTQRPAAQDEEVHSLRKLRADLKLACSQNNAIDAKMSLLAMGKILWPYETLLSVGDLTEHFKLDRSKVLLHELESVLYKESSEWHGTELWKMLEQEFQQKAKDTKDPTEVLPRLYLGEKP